MGRGERRCFDIVPGANSLCDHHSAVGGTKFRTGRFAGCAVVVSHDLRFPDRIATHLLPFEGDSEVVWDDGDCAVDGCEIVNFNLNLTS